MNNSSLWIGLQRMRVPFLVLVVSYTIAITGLLIIEGIDNNGNPYQMSIFDAFYFVTYTATTIGFGETPYEFTHLQRLWVSFSIYLLVLGWFYSIGTLVGLLQDKLFLLEIKKGKFRRSIRNIKQKFIIVLGYNHTTSEIIKKALDAGFRTVVIEKDEQKANNLILENFTPHVPVLMGDAYDHKALEMAGIKSHHCKAIVSLFENDALNLRIALTSKLLNKYVKLAVKSTTTNHTENLYDLGAEIVENPFEIIASQFQMGLTAPNLLKIKRWVYKLGTLNESLQKPPNGKYIVCGYGRLGKSIYNVLKENNLDSTFIEIDKAKLVNLTKDEASHLIVGDGDDKEMLSNAGTKDAVCIIAGTNNDTVNLSILATAKKLKPSIITMARENEVEEFSIFGHANVDHIIMPSKTLINKTTNALINPLSDKFIQLVKNQDEHWGQLLVKNLIETIDNKPKLYELTIDKKSCPQIVEALEDNIKLKLSLLKTSLRNNNMSNNIIALLLIKENDDELLLPSWDTVLKKEDKILFACDENAIDDLEDITQNMHEFHYALHGEKKLIFSKKIKKQIKRI